MNYDFLIMTDWVFRKSKIISKEYEPTVDLYLKTMIPTETH